MKFSGVEESRNHIRFIKLDEQRTDTKVNYISAYNQNCRVVTSDEIGHEIFSHDDVLLRESLDAFGDQTNLKIPADFYEHTQIWNVPGLLFARGVQVDVRVLRQQVFLSGSNYPIPNMKSEMVLMHGIGNALWNFIIARLWNWNINKQNQYRELRSIPFPPKYQQGQRTQRGDQRRHKYQSNLFYVASEDFRYLFGSAYSGKDEWHLRDIQAPGSTVAAFWNEELESYDSSFTAQEEEGAPTEVQEEEAVAE